MKFSEMKYERPDFDKAKSDAEKIKKSFSEASSFEEADKAFIEWDELVSHIDTMISLAYTRNTINTSDEFYENEIAYIDEISPLFAELDQSFSRLLTETPFRTQLEEKYGTLLFKNAEISLKSFSPEIIPETQSTNKLETTYQKLLASAQIDFEGEKRTISQMSPFKQSEDDNIRKNAWLAEGIFYKEHSEELDDIFDKMVKLRTEMAKKLGYDNFVELGYLQMMRNCYTPADIEKFRQSVPALIIRSASPMLLSDSGTEIRSLSVLLRIF